MPKYIKMDALIEDLQYDIELDAKTLDDLDFADTKERELVQLDKDIKQNVIDILEHAPAADVKENIHAHWVKVGQSFLNPNKFLNYACSKCGFDIEQKKFRFCPNCGAQME